MNIFVSYNTDAVIKAINSENNKKHDTKAAKNHPKDKNEGDFDSLYDKIISEYKEYIEAKETYRKEDANVHFEEVVKLRKIGFELIKEYTNNMNEMYKSSGKSEDFNYYYDILDDEFDSPQLTNHIISNKEKIRDYDIFLFVVSYIEISFWQLQEAYFASYYNKRIFIVPTNKYVKLLKRGKLNHYLKKKRHSWTRN